APPRGADLGLGAGHNPRPGLAHTGSRLGVAARGTPGQRRPDTEVAYAARNASQCGPNAQLRTKIAVQLRGVRPGNPARQAASPPLNCQPGGFMATKTKSKQSTRSRRY